MAELKLCPFCGCEPIAETFKTAREKEYRFRIRCTNDKCRISQDWDWFAYADALAAWNRREHNG